MQWFGKSWGAPICTTTEHAKTPIDKICGNCARDIQQEDQGLLIPFSGYTQEYEKSTTYVQGSIHLIYHLDCFLKDVGVKM